MEKKDFMLKESELDDTQLLVLQAMYNKSCVVTGCAGSGKSVLALHKALSIQKEHGSNYQVIVYTKALYNYMKAGKDFLGLTGVFTYHWDWKENRRMPSADFTIVDEVQDFTEAEILEFINATKRNVFFFGDSAQSIYNSVKKGGTFPPKQIEFLLKTPTKLFELYNNYRLPVSVAKVALPVIGEDFIPGIYKNKVTTTPRFLKIPSFEEQMQEIVNIIKEREYTNVGILLPYNSDVKRVYDSLSQKGGNYEVKWTSRKKDGTFESSTETLDFDSNNPKIMTYHSSKGLQFEVVFLPVMENYNPRDNTLNALYVAMTRTFSDLYVLYSGALPTVFSGIPKELYSDRKYEIVEEI